MIKNIAYFPSQCAGNSVPVLRALLAGAQRHGIRCMPDNRDSDAAIIWSVLWNGRMQLNQQVYEHYRQLGRPVIVVEVGALKRNVTWKISVNHTTAQGYYGHLENLDWDRPRRLGIALQHTQPVRPHIVIALQHTRSLQVADMSPDWLFTTIQILRNNTDRPIVVRPHPRCRAAVPFGVEVEHPRAVPGTYDSFDMRYDCHAVVNYNSGPGIQAAIAGVRPLVDFSSLAYPVSVGFPDIEQPYDRDRDLWLTQICHTEYTLEEIDQGLWLKRLGPALV